MGGMEGRASGLWVACQGFCGSVFNFLHDTIPFFKEPPFKRIICMCDFIFWLSLPPNHPPENSIDMNGDGGEQDMMMVGSQMVK